MSEILYRECNVCLRNIHMTQMHIVRAECSKIYMEYKKKSQGKILSSSKCLAQSQEFKDLNPAKSRSNTWKSNYDNISKSNTLTTGKQFHFQSSPIFYGKS